LVLLETANHSHFGACALPPIRVLKGNQKYCVSTVHFLVSLTINPHTKAPLSHCLKSLTIMAAAAKLRALLSEKDKIVVCPGIYDGFTARISIEAGFECLYMVRIY
jgi:hypothetical protein